METLMIFQIFLAFVSDDSSDDSSETEASTVDDIDKERFIQSMIENYEDTSKSKYNII